MNEIKPPALGAKVFFYDSEKTVIGVIRNFYHRSLKEKHLPMVFWYSNYADYFSLKISADKVRETVESVREVWNGIYADSPFEYFFLDETYNQQYKADQQFGHVIGIFCMLAALVACLGLFGLSSFT
ncbi:MAG: ABC transporter permease, partial [Marivirga sp.]|nr:ABC transporter permease [Marivirga sp.]